MLIKHLKGFFFYVIISVIIVFSIVSDSKAWNEKENDIKNTLGSPPPVLSKAESFEIMDMKGNIIKSSQMDKNSYMLVLWSMEESERNKLFFDMLSELIQKGEFRGIEILPVNIGGTAGEVKKFFDDNNYGFDCYLDVDKTTKWAFNRSRTVPMVYILDSEGTIKFRQEVGTKQFNDYFIRRLAQYK